MTNVARLLVALSALTWVGLAFGQDYPVKPIRVIVPLSPGGGGDAMFRHVAEKLSVRLGQTVIVENRPGAGGTLGADAVAKAPPDGYTLLLATNASHAQSPALYKKVSYDPSSDFTHVGLIGYVPFILMAHPSLGVRSLQDFIALAKNRPGEYIYASSGNGSGSHLGMELLKSLAGIDVRHIPYKGNAPAFQDLLGGHVSVMIDGVSSTYPHILAGRVRALAVTSPKRVGAIPDVPTIAESGFPGYEMTAWTGLAGPAQMPAHIVSKLNAELRAVASLPEVRDWMTSIGWAAAPSTAAEMGALVKSETAKWTAVVKSSGLQVD